MSCICTHNKEPTVGSHDPVTGEWDPDRQTEHHFLDMDPDCPMHANPIHCCVCGRTSCGHVLGELDDRPWQVRPGWSMRADRKFFACPDHSKEVPPAC